MKKEKMIKSFEKTADKICAECLVSKHSEEYRRAVIYISELFDMQSEILFDQNNIPYLNEDVEEIPQFKGTREALNDLGV